MRIRNSRWQQTAVAAEMLEPSREGIGFLPGELRLLFADVRLR
jgi:hypothetical protein